MNFAAKTPLGVEPTRYTSRRNSSRSSTPCWRANGPSSQKVDPGEKASGGPVTKYSSGWPAIPVSERERDNSVDPQARVGTYQIATAHSHLRTLRRPVEPRDCPDQLLDEELVPHQAGSTVIPTRPVNGDQGQATGIDGSETCTGRNGAIEQLIWCGPDTSSACLHLVVEGVRLAGGSVPFEQTWCIHRRRAPLR